jgi:carbon monoxide dehydrogenase subunit G
MRTPHRGLLGLALALGSLAVLSPLTAQQREGFDAAERAALLGGELVRRERTHPESGRMLYGGSSWQRIAAPPEHVWARVTDVGALTELIPSVDLARLVEEHGDERLVWVHHSYGIAETSYHIRMRLDHAQHAIAFELDRSRPHDIDAGRGYLELTPHRDGTVVAWGMLVDPGRGLVMDLFGPMLGEWLLLPPRCLRDDLRGAPSC